MPETKQRLKQLGIEIVHERKSIFEIQWLEIVFVFPVVQQYFPLLCAFTGTAIGYIGALLIHV